MIRTSYLVGCALQNARLKSYPKFQRRASGDRASARVFAANGARSPVLSRKWLLERPDSQVDHMLSTVDARQHFIHNSRLHPAASAADLACR